MDQHIPTIFTVGFSNLALETFLANLDRHRVQVIVDVRSRPFASYTPHFNKGQIEPAAKAAGLHYLYLGAELGGQPTDPALYDDKGYVLYDRIAATEPFQEAIRRLLAGLGKGFRTVLACGEENPRHCHRRLLIGRVLRERGVALAHLLADGGIISESELLDEERRMPRQLSLLESPQEPPWRSSQPYATGDDTGRSPF